MSPSKTRSAQGLAFGKWGDASYNPPVRSARLLAASLVSLSLLSACGSSPNTAEESGQSGAAARIGVASAVVLATQNLLTQSALRPAAVLGVYAAQFLSGNAVPATGSAVLGIAAQLQLYFGQQTDSQDTAAVLSQLGTTLQVDVPDMLDRSADRGDALDEYLAFLEGAMEEARVARDAVAAEGDVFDDDVSAKRKEAGTLRREVNTAVRNKDFSLAGAKQELLGIAEAKVAELDAKRRQLSGMEDLFDELLEVAEERLAAVTSNRDALIAGITVIELPGVTDLGILQKGLR